ncbi:MAG: hypothetical protein K8F91_15505 [Candidatus Obscuribacterales bacterium]|nr:hypothetical protein [Candidatus Obscuribacterales bacterium]
MRKANHGPDFHERAVSSVCYLPLGFFIGIGYILLKGKHNNSHFFRFNFYQAVLVQISMTVLQMGGEAVTGIFTSLIGMFSGVLGSGVATVNSAIVWFASFVIAATGLLLVYGIIWCLLGKYAEIPYISNAIRAQVR